MYVWRIFWVFLCVFSRISCVLLRILSRTFTYFYVCLRIFMYFFAYVRVFLYFLAIRACGVFCVFYVFLPVFAYFVHFLRILYVFLHILAHALYISARFLRILCAFMRIWTRFPRGKTNRGKTKSPKIFSRKKNPQKYPTNFFLRHNAYFCPENPPKK